MRTGIGYDIHPLTAGRALVIGGVTIPFEKGLDGWSDADVLAHAIMDALLGAAALGDIGVHFPPGQEEFRGVSSISLLAQVRDILARQGWQAVNIDATVITERPKLRDYIEPMRRNMADALGLDITAVSVKASTTNGIGEIAAGKGIAALAVATIEQRSNS